MAPPPRRKKKRARRRATGPTQAEQSEILHLYQQAVQAPHVDCAFMTRVYGEVFGRSPARLREDFSGAAAVCCAWVEQGPEHEAWGVDLDARTLAWGLDHNVSGLPAAARGRVHLVEGDVRSTQTPPVDVVCAQNFSYCILDTRDELRRYFERCRLALAEVGLLVVDLFGGSEALEDEKEDVIQHAGFDYVWEQARYDPINARGLYKIHFRFPDGSAHEDAFVYEWRLWTIPEIRELMLEAGFDRADVYWEDEDPKTGAGTGNFSLQTVGAADPAWNAYVIGVRGPRGAR